MTKLQFERCGRRAFTNSTLIASVVCSEVHGLALKCASQKVKSCGNTFNISYKVCNSGLCKLFSKS